MRAQRFDFVPCELAPVAHGQIAQQQRAFADPDQAHNVQPQDACDLPNLSFAPLAHDDAQPDTVGTALEYFDPGLLRQFVLFERNPGAPPADLVDGWRAIDEHAIFFFDRKTWMGQTVGQVAVVRQQDQPFAIGVEAPNRENANVVWDELRYGGTVVCVTRCRNHPNWLVQHEIAVRLGWLTHVNNLSVDGDAIMLRVRARANLAHDTAIDGNPPTQNHLFRWS